MDFNTSTPDPGYRKAIHPQEVAPPINPAPELKYSLEVLEGDTVLLEKDVAIEMPDGVKLYADIYRPVSEIAERTPSIVLFAPFGKHGAVPREKFENMGVDFTKLSKYTYWELPDPLQWCGEYGYSLVSVDPRGTWWSEGGRANYFSPEEGRDGYHVVEWIAQQPWSTGSVGWGAVSYYAMSAYQTAVLRPPHLKALLLWEAASDIYREIIAPGGIPNVPFQQMWMDMTGNGLGECEDHGSAILDHPLFDPFWQSKVVDWRLIDVPAFSVTGWSSLGLHLRGTIAAWKALSSQNKYLLIHGGREWSEYYKAENIQKQRLFFDRFLKNMPNAVEQWPRVQLDIRRSASDSTRCTSHDFPPRAQLTKYYLSPDGALAAAPSASAGYTSLTAHKPDSAVHFDWKFDKETEVSGYASLRLFIQCRNSPDVDLFTALQKIGPDGKEVKFYNSTQKIEASASLGWLRVSHRELDTQGSTPERPVHLHHRRQWLRPSDIVEVQIELWPSSTVWEAGSTMRVAVKGSSFVDTEHVSQFKGPAHGFGEVRVWAGGEYESCLLVPEVLNS